MSRPELDPIESGTDSWDSVINDNNSKLFDYPLPVFFQNSLAALSSNYPPGFFDACLAVVWDGTPGTAVLMYVSNGSAWQELNSSSTGRLLSTTLIQGSIDDDIDTTPGYIDTASVEESDGAFSPAIYSSDLVGVTGVWSDILPIAIAPDVMTTRIRLNQYYTSTSVASDEDHNSGVILIDWGNSKINGWIMNASGGGLVHHDCYRYTGVIGAGNNDFSGTLQNGSFASSGSVPTFRVNGTTKTVERLPMTGRFRNVGFEINNYS